MLLKACYSADMPNERERERAYKTESTYPLNFEKKVTPEGGVLNVITCKLRLSQ